MQPVGQAELNFAELTDHEESCLLNACNKQKTRRKAGLGCGEFLVLRGGSLRRFTGSPFLNPAKLILDCSTRPNQRCKIELRGFFRSAHEF